MFYKEEFPVGAKVRMKESAVNSYYVEIQRRVKDGRIGIVTGHSYPSEVPLVTLPKDGRKREYQMGQIRADDWEVVELPAPQLPEMEQA